jgi:cob(I)alamin adenosyltransferase
MLQRLMSAADSPRPSGPPSGSPSAAAVVSAGTQLAIIADNVEQYRNRVADLATPFVGTTRDDLVTAIHEAERQLRNAERSLTRAARLAQ